MAQGVGGQDPTATRLAFATTRPDPEAIHDSRGVAGGLLGWRVAVTFAAAAGLFTAWTAHNENASHGRLLFDGV
jgi:hypothetical protein